MLNYVLYLQFSIFIQDGIAFLAICDRTYPKRLAFSFLDEIHTSFLQEYPLDQIEAVNRPYAFLKFGITSSIMKLLNICAR